MCVRPRQKVSMMVFRAIDFCATTATGDVDVKGCSVYPKDGTNRGVLVPIATCAMQSEEVTMVVWQSEIVNFGVSSAY